MHKPLRSREDILDFAARHAPSNACARAIREDRVVITAPNNNGWHLAIVSKTGGKWFLHVTGNEVTRKYRVIHDRTAATPEPETSTGLCGHADGETPVHDRRVQVDQDREESRQVTDNELKESD